MSSHAIALKAGTFVNDLQIAEVLNVSDYAITYLVSDPAIGTRFALKEYVHSGQVVRQQDGSLSPRDDALGERFKAGLEQFREEARVIAMLDHPGIVKVLRFFEANGTAYYLMPYFPGDTLDTVIESAGTLNREEAKRLMQALMDALEHLHSQGVVHQDIKPANIMISAEQQPVLLDFGVAASQPVGPVAVAADARTAFTAPEQIRPGGDIGPWTDIYAVAGCLYQAVSGQTPMPAADRTAALGHTGADPMTPFSELAPAGLFGGLTDVVEQGLHIDISDRPADAGQWKKSFSSLDWHRSVVSSRENSGFAAEKREWLPVVLLGVFITALVAIAILLMTDWSPDRFPVSQEPANTQAPGVQQAPVAERTATPLELQRWQAALKADTIIGYRRFIEDYPESIYRNQADIQLDILDENHWTRLSSENTVEAYERYLELFPDGTHQAEALQRIEAIQQAQAQQQRQRLERQRREQQDWQNALDTRTIASMDRYINNWPAGSHVEEARRIRRVLQDEANDNEAFSAARKLNTKESFQAYIDAFPRGAHVTTALQSIDDLTLRPGKVFRDCKRCPQMVVIPAGAFWQGSEDNSELALGMEKPRRLVTFDKPFAMGTHEVTMAQWDACVDDGGCNNRPSDNGWGRAERPVIMVSWNDAEEYIQWLRETSGQTYRLPSESEWEYAARAGQQGEWPGGDPELVCSYGNIAGAETGFQWQHQGCEDELALGTLPVGSFKPNEFGLYDIIGNVSEWTADCMNLSYLDAPVDGSAWGRGICSSHMTRGGSWITGTKEIRLPARFNLKNGDRNDFTGFRVVRDIDE